LESRGDRVIGVDVRDADIVLDLADPTQRGELAACLQAVGARHLDSIVASAGVGGSSASCDKVVRLNYFGAVNTVLQLRPLLLGSEAPRVCMLGSIALLGVSGHENLNRALSEGENEALAAFADLDGPLAYAVTKRAIATWVRVNAVSDAWLRDRILLNCVAPGTIETNMTKRLLSDPSKRMAALESIPHPLGVGQPEHVAKLIGYLVSRENGFTTGQVIFVDGGHEALTCGPDLPRRRPT
jgi:NAD(P)-dependent dehydrogenase (short-subunit alcohol dehydrogenase family)